jgi:tripartite-type tricarboxylate transporter receptor subunit TctC
MNLTRLLALACACVPAVCGAQSYPNKPIRLVITYPPGGTTDFVGRPVAQKMSELLGQQVVVDNRGGAGGVIGTMMIAQSPPDGYNLLLGTSAGMTINPQIHSKLPYDPLKDFAPVSRTNVNPQILVAHPALAANNIKELIALAKAKPGTLNVSSSGVGTPNHLGAEMLKFMAGIDIVHIAYKGGGPATTDLIAGQTQLQFSSIPTVLQHIKAGRLKILAIGSAKRSPALPEVPTIAESGVPGYEYTTWYGIFAPKGTPAPILNKLSDVITKAVSSPEIAQRFIPQGAEPSPSTPQELTTYMREEYARWGKVIKAANIRADGGTL